jgi:hypothetical protein
MLDRPVSGRIFFEQVMRYNLAIGRLDQISLVLAKWLTNLAALRQIGFLATGACSASNTSAMIPSAARKHSPTSPHPSGPTTAPMPPGSVRRQPRSRAPTGPAHPRLLPHGFTNRDLRTLLGPKIRRYRATDRGLQHALLCTHAHDHLLHTGLAELNDPDPPGPSRLHTTAGAYQAAFHDLAQRAHLAA